MLGIKEGVLIWYVSGITVIRYGKYRLFSEVVAVGGNPYNGDAYCFMSESHQKVKIILYASHKRYLYDVTFDSGNKFMKVLTEDGKTLCVCDYKHIEALLQCPVIPHMKIRKKWSMPLTNWGTILQQLAIKFGGKFMLL